MVLEKKKIAIIAGVSTAVLVTALGVGLGVGLNTSSTSSSNNGEENPSYVDTNHYATNNGIGVTTEEITNGKTLVNGEEYAIVKKNEDFYLEIPSFSGRIQPDIITRSIFNVDQKTFSSSDFANKGEGKDNFYNINYIIPSLSIGVVRIPNDGKIYGGFIESTDANIDYEINSKLEKVFPNGYELGDFEFSEAYSTYIGGINMLKLQKLQTLLATSSALNTMEDVENALQNVPTTTEFGFFRYTEGNQEFIGLVTNSEPTKPSEIGYSPAVFDAPIEYPEVKYWSPSIPKPTLSDHSQRDYDFQIVGYTTKQFSNLHVTLEKSDQEDLSQETKSIDLNDLYLPISYEPGSFTHPVLGSLKPSVQGVISFDDTVITENDETPDISLEADSTFTSPTLLMKLTKSVFNDAEYATTATRRKHDELLINVDANWLDYFKNTANDSRVKNLAKQLDITIRFKERNLMMKERISKH